MKTEWDYTDRAHTYDARADYSDEAIRKLLMALNCEQGDKVADIGAGTGKLTKLLLAAGMEVSAVEPNDNMRMYGKKNTEGQSVEWSEGVGESNGLPNKTYAAAFFGSSFNVVDQNATLLETKRILKPGGGFACMWNHRDINDPLQSDIERIIAKRIPDYNYGLRRQDPTSVIENSGLFDNVEHLAESFIVQMKREEIIAAWRSHDTLFRQAGDAFSEIIWEIESLIDADIVDVPYTTRIWLASLNNAR